MCAGCSARELRYDTNYGYELDKLNSGDITFNVYHTDPKDHSWELIGSFPCDPQPGHYYDVVVNGEENKVTAVLRDTTCTKENDDSASYSGIDVSSFDYTVDGFKGNIPGWETYTVEDKKGEQNVRLYVVSNSNIVSVPGEISVDTPYDSEGASIDNILITLVMN